jgi:hypothetical protein
MTLDIETWARHRLCIYDPRNPDHEKGEDEDGNPIEPRGPIEGCACDACFYGRHKLADALLTAQATIASLSDLLKRGRDLMVEHGQELDKAKAEIARLKAEVERLGNLVLDIADGQEDGIAEAREIRTGRAR